VVWVRIPFLNLWQCHIAEERNPQFKSINETVTCCLWWNCQRDTGCLCFWFESDFMLHINPFMPILNAQCDVQETKI
jgi:hypothetical protein